MRKIGILGGMSWESTAHYYSIINREVARRMGGTRSADCLIRSLDFSPIAAWQEAGAWEMCANAVSGGLSDLIHGGAQALLIASNTAHKALDYLDCRFPVPLLHIADVTADALEAGGHRRVALLGTRFTMEDAFYKRRLEARGISVAVPEARERQAVHRIIFDELVMGIQSASSKEFLLDVLSRQQALGADAAILGCTELGLLIGRDDIALPLFDTAELHAIRAAQVCMGAPL